MRRRGASEARAALRGLRGAYRGAYNLRQKLIDQFNALPLRAHEVRRAIENERALAEATGQDDFVRTLSPDPAHSSAATDALYERLDDAAVAEVVAALTPTEQGFWDAARPADRRRLTLAFGVHHELPSVLEATGLSADRPPPEVHAMERSAESAGGSTYYADMIVAAALESDFEFEGGMAGLDFGCSSGRVVRVLAAAYPQLRVARL